MFRWIFLTIFLTWAGYAGFISSYLSPLTSEEHAFPQSHRLIKIKNIILEKFDNRGPTDLNINIFWGVKDINRQKSSMWDPLDIGEAILDDKFDMDEIESRNSLK